MVNILRLIASGRILAYLEIERDRRELSMKKYFKPGLLLVMCILFLSGSQVKAQSIKISAPTNTIFENQKIKLRVKPSEKKGRMKWKTSNSRIASVSQSGVVTGKRAGKVKIRAISADNHQKKASYVIRVRKFKERSLSAKTTVVSSPGSLFSAKKNYQTFQSKDEIRKYLDSIRKENKYSFYEVKKELKKYKESFFRKKSLCIVCVAAGSSSMPVAAGEVAISQNKKGTVIGNVHVKVGEQPSDVLWTADVVSYFVIMELDKRDAGIIQSYQVVND